MKHIHIINPYNSSAMQRMSLPLKTEFAKLYEITESEKPDNKADLNIHVPWHTMVGHEEKDKSKHLIMYTHVNPPDKIHLFRACEKADIITAMSFMGRRELIDLGVDPCKIWVIYSAADSFQFCKRKILIVGFSQPNGRKRESILFDLAWKEDLSPFHFIMVGDGWEDMAEKLKLLGVSAEGIPPQNDEGMRKLYAQADALLVTGYAEGGPLPLLEAMRSGVRVFSPPFGYASDLLDDACFYNNVEELAKKLNLWITPALRNHLLVTVWSWQHYAAEYALLIGRTLNEDIDLFPEMGMSRYAQILDIIDEYHPRKIVEIGTWNGNRAIQMIQQASKYRRVEDIYYQGFDLFEKQTGEHFQREFSKYAWPQSLVSKRIEATRANYELIQGDTKTTLPINLASADLYFIDGGHSEETIHSDAEQVLAKMSLGSIAIFDDYYHEGKQEGLGCNTLIDDINPNYFEITHLPIKTQVNDGRVIGMVKVRKHADIYLQMQE